MRLLIIFLFIILFAGACTPVRTTTTTKSKKSEGSNIEQSKSDVAEYDDRFIDTTLIVLQDVQVQRQNDIRNIFSKAVQDFRNADYDKACQQFSIFSETLAAGDSLLYEAIFYDCECKILDDKLIDAKIILLEILDDDNLTSRVEQKILVRIGQIECVAGSPEQAQIYFDELKAKYPDSKYNQLANCDSVE